MVDLITGADRHIPNHAPVRANYNFVPLNEKVLKTPLESVDLSKPVADAISGTIKMRWTAETPILVGSTDEGTQGNENHLKINGCYALPGASLRGMVRTIVEMISFSHLNFYDDNTFGTRDFNDVTWKKKIGPRGLGEDNYEQPNVGLLKLSREENGNQIFTLQPCELVPLLIADICNALRLPPSEDWHNLPINVRREKLIRYLGTDGPCDLQALGYPSEGIPVVTNKIGRAHV